MKINRAGVFVYIISLFVLFLIFVAPCLLNEDVPNFKIARESFYSVSAAAKPLLIDKMDAFKKEHRELVQQNLYQDNFEQFLPPAGYLDEMEKETVDNFGGSIFYMSKNKMRWLSNNLMSPSVWDEQNTFRALYNIRPEKLEFNPHYFRYGGAWLYPAGLVLYAGSKAGLFKTVKDLSYYMWHPDDIRRISVLGKGFGIFCYLAAIVILLLISLRFFNARIFYIAGFFMVFCPAVIVESVYFKPMLTSLFWYLVAVYFMLKIAYLKGSLKRNCIYAGIASGLSAGSLMPSASIVLPLFLVILYPRIKSFSVSIKKAISSPYPDIRYCFYAGICFVFSFVLTNPYTVLSFKEFMKEMFWNVNYHNYYSFFDPKVHIGNIAILLDGFGILFGMLILISLLWVIFKRLDKKNGLILLSCVAYYLWGYSTNYALKIWHALIPIVPLLIIFPAQFIDAMLNKKSIFIKVIAYSAVTIVAVYSVLNSAFYTVLFQQQARIRSGEWINKNIPAGSSIGTFIDNCGLAFNYPYYNYFRYRFVNDWDFELSRIKKYLPQYYIYTDSYLPKWITVPENRIPEEYKKYIDPASQGTHFRWLLKISEEEAIRPNYNEIASFSNDAGWLGKLFKNKLALWWTRQIKVYRRI